MSLGGALSKSGALSKVFSPITLSKVFYPIRRLCMVGALSQIE